MAKLDKEKRDELVDFVRTQVAEQLELKKIQGKIFIEFGVYFSLKSVCYYIDKAERDKRIAKYQKENEIMRRWQGNTEKPDPDVAELLFKAITKSDHDANEEILKLLS